MSPSGPGLSSLAARTALTALTALIALTVAAWPSAGRADDTVAAAAEPRWLVSVSSTTATPAVLTQGLGLGALAEVTRTLGRGPLFASARAGWTQASMANTSWLIDHHQFVGALGAGAATTVGAGQLWASVGAGASGLYEVLSRHQRERIDSAGVPGGTQTSFALGPWGFGEVGVSVRLRGAFRVLVAGGATLARTTVDDAALWRAGVAARLGVGFAF